MSVYLHRRFRAATGGEYRHALAYRRRILPCSVDVAHETRIAAIEYDYPLFAFRVVRDGQDVRKRDTGVARRVIRRNEVAADRVDMTMARIVEKGNIRVPAKASLDASPELGLALNVVNLPDVKIRIPVAVSLQQAFQSGRIVAASVERIARIVIYSDNKRLAYCHLHLLSSFVVYLMVIFLYTAKCIT